jgi:hypothetical protein
MAGLMNTIAVTLTLLVHEASGYYSLLSRDGPVSDLVGYSGMAYHAMRYEPLCGNLGLGSSSYSKPLDLSGLCFTSHGPDAFGNDSADSLAAISDTTGTRLEGLWGSYLSLCHFKP